MRKVERSILLNATVEEVFRYLDDPTHEPEFVPGIDEVTDVVGQGLGKTYRWSYKMMGLRFRGESKYTEYVPNQRVVHESKGGIHSIWTWTFGPEDGGTRVNLAVKYDVPVPVLGKVAEQLVLRQNDREADLGMANLKARLESQEAC